MDLRVRIAALKKTVPALLSHNNVTMLTNPSSTGKKTKAMVEKVYSEMLKSVQFLDATLVALEKALNGVAKTPWQDQDVLFANADSLLRQCRRVKPIIVKNVTDLEKALPVLKKEFKIP